MYDINGMRALACVFLLLVNFVFVFVVTYCHVLPKSLSVSLPTDRVISIHERDFVIATAYNSIL